MRKVTALGTILILLVGIWGCGGGSGATVSEEEAKEAFIVGFVSVFSASIGLAFGQDVPGAALDAETQDLTLDGFSIADLAGEESGIAYTTVSGTAMSEDGAMVADLALEGGPVDTIAFRITGEQMQSEAGFSITVTVNGREMDLEITESDLTGE